MTESHTFFSRIGNWFRKGRNGDLPLEDGVALRGEIEPCSTFLRPWARQEAALARLQEGFGTLTDLMAAVRDSLDRQGRRQDQLLDYLAHLPEALQSIPESNRAHAEALKAMYQQMVMQGEQQKHLADILDKIGDSGREQQQTLGALHEHVEALHQHDQAIADKLSSVGSAMQSVSRSSDTAAQVLQQLRDNLSTRDGELERILHRHNTRFTTMLAIAIFLSVAALTAVGVVGYLLLNRA